MDKPEPPPELWLTDEVVSILLRALQHPVEANHDDLTMRVLNSQPLLDAHMHALVRAIMSDRRFKSSAKVCGSAQMLHKLLFILGGGESAKPRRLRAPAVNQKDRLSVSWAANLLRDAKKASNHFFSQRDSFKHRKQWTPLHNLRSAPYAFAQLCLDDSDGTSLPPPPPPPPPPPSTPAAVERERRLEGSLMLARGTHIRYGLFSPLRHLAGHHGVLQKIAELAEMNARAYIPEPSPRERSELHRHLRQQLAEIISLRQKLDEQIVIGKSLERERNQAVRHAASAFAEMKIVQERERRLREENDERVEEARELGIKLKLRVNQLN